MARTGITYGEVAEAATQLVGKGRNPTVEQVRILLGTGSSTTIANHLRQWKANQEATSLISVKENIPPELIAVMKGLWERLLNHSQEKIAVIESSYQQTISTQQQEIEKYKSNSQRWQKLFNQWQQEKVQLDNDKLTLEQAIEFAHKENSSLNAKQDALLQQLQDKRERIDELHRLQKQAQENLEHYREAAREQRILDQQQFDQQKQQLQTENKILNEQLIMQREKMTALQQQHQALQHNYQSLENNNDVIKTQLQQLSIQLEEVEKIKTEHLHASLHWKNQLNELQETLNEKINQLSHIQIETKLVSQQLMNANHSIENLENLNKFLTHDKWLLGQEKAQLEGQLKQMQKMITV